MYAFNEKITSMYCIRCGKKLPIEDYYTGCPDCLARGENASVSFTYSGSIAPKTDKRGMLRYASRLPYTDWPILGEGQTPLVEMESLERDYGLDKVYVKNECQNPTGSHKDRTSPLVVARAKALGKNTVVAATSGNAGASLAAYAAKGGLRCKILCTDAISPVWRLSIKAAGAELIIKDTPEARWEEMKEGVEKEGWYPATNYILPPVGSNCFGIQGYKTIAYEIYEELPEKMPDYIIVPVSKGDLLWGIYEGFKELKEQGFISVLPVLIAVEPVSRIERVMQGDNLGGPFPGDCSLTESISGNNMTYQAVLAVRETKGFAVTIPKEKVIQSVYGMGKLGMYLETSSAVVLEALKEARATGKIEEGKRVVIIATSNGFKNYTELFHDEK